MEKNKGVPFFTLSPSLTKSLGFKQKKSVGFKAKVLERSDSDRILFASPFRFKLNPFLIFMSTDIVYYLIQIGHKFNNLICLLKNIFKLNYIIFLLSIVQLR